MMTISRTAGSMSSGMISCNSKTVHKKDISELAKKVRTVQCKVNEFKTKSSVSKKELGSFFREFELKSQSPVIKLEIRKCLEGVKILKEMMKSTSYEHAKFKHTRLNKMEKMLEKGMKEIRGSIKDIHDSEMYNQMMLNYERKVIASKASRPVREMGEYNGGMVK
ncbi:hypothetical protein [Hafnia paralvei]|uniref:hypothetical protein n=1 Tax=Hafnia paralvei TaxID=546367 RepID=UPI00300C81E2